MEQEATYEGVEASKSQLDVAVRSLDERWVIPRQQSGRHTEPSPPHQT